MNERYTFLNLTSTAMARSYLESSSGQPWWFSWVLISRELAEVTYPLCKHDLADNIGNICRRHIGLPTPSVPDTQAEQRSMLQHFLRRGRASDESRGSPARLNRLLVPQLRYASDLILNLPLRIPHGPMGKRGRRSSQAWNWHLSGNPVTCCRALEIGEWLGKC